ncbi:acetyl-CoA carboxylase carboxyl transferase subunit alpha [Babesia caballi]|uniref:Acetyl-CoA carboxylase carboxyl transferase subunit alpha n=1 Tax=Babesia caballi TaxID=5871 RepID=A0AAV4M1G5_BABCB|nr:acetyl-CoA carboxylase carboxyl transferase subunit alpha [Babesia caballi]
MGYLAMYPDDFVRLVVYEAGELVGVPGLFRLGGGGREEGQRINAFGFVTEALETIVRPQLRHVPQVAHQRRQFDEVVPRSCPATRRTQGRGPVVPEIAGGGWRSVAARSALLQHQLRRAQQQGCALAAGELSARRGEVLRVAVEYVPVMSGFHDGSLGRPVIGYRGFRRGAGGV